MYVLALDIGSSSVRVALIDRRGVIAPGTLQRADLSLETDRAGSSVVDLDRLRALAEQVIDAVLQTPEAQRGIDAVGVCTFWHSLVALDAAGQPLTDVLTWADTRSAPEAELLRSDLDAEAIRQRTGCPLHPSYLPAKILWLRRHQPDVLRNSHRLVSCAQALTSVWLGADDASVSIASGSGLFNRQSMSWDAEILNYLDIAPEMLGDITAAPELLPPIRSCYAARWPALRGVPWRAPIGDGAASNVGVGCVGADRLALTLGTSAAMRRCEPGEPNAPVPSGLWRYSLDPVHSLTGGALSEGGNVFAWLSATLRLPSHAEIEATLMKRAPGEHELTVLPFWAGERSIGWNGDATAAIHGMRMSTSALDIVQASLEAVAYRLATVYDALLIGDETVVATGGALLGSSAWQQIIADCLGVPLVVAPTEESSLRGTALLAWDDVSGEALTDNQPPAGSTLVEPRQSAHNAHRELRVRQQRLYEREGFGATTPPMARDAR